jgi:hypothetical protein
MPDNASRNSDPVVVEPVVSREKLMELLALQTEYSSLEFKGVCDLDHKPHVLALVEHCGAMSVRGGFIVVGVDGRGSPTGTLTQSQARRFDEAHLRPKLSRWLPDSLQLASQTHELHGCLIVLIYVAPNAAGCASFRADGQYREPGNDDPVVVFRQGDIYWRNGTKTERISQAGLEEIIAQRVRHERQLWMDEHDANLTKMIKGLSTITEGSAAARKPSPVFNLDLPRDLLIENAHQLVRLDDDVPLRQQLRRAEADVRRYFANRDQDAVDQVFDQLTCLAATFLDLDRITWFERVLATLVTIYGIPTEDGTVVINEPPAESSRMWLAIVERVFGLGALATRLERWPVVRRLADHVVADPQLGRVWIKHAMTMGSRARLFVAADNRKLSLLSMARERIRRLDCLHPDTGDQDERILTSLTQFDFLGCVIALDRSGGPWRFYPSFARFRSERVRPIADRLVQDHDLRAIMFTKGDRAFAEALSEIDKVAQREGFMYDGWEGYSDTVTTFIESAIS